MRALLKNFSVTYHQFIFFCVHLIILRFLGISYSGEIAYVAAITGVVAVIVSMRWDIEILVSSINTKLKRISNFSLQLFSLRSFYLNF